MMIGHKAHIHTHCACKPAASYCYTPTLIL